MRIWGDAHLWEGGWLPSLYEFSVLKPFIVKLKVTKHPYEKSSYSLNIFKSSFWKLLFKSKASSIPSGWRASLSCLLETPG